MIGVISILGAVAIWFAGDSRAVQFRRMKYTHVAEYIVNGQNAAVNEYPWQVMLTLNGNFVCGGSILHRRYILTAAHCIDLCHNSPGDYHVIAGDHDWSTASGTEQVLQARKIVVHPRYNDITLKHDIAIIKMRGRFNVTTSVSPVALSNATFDIEAETSSDCWSTGYGVSSQSPDQFVPILQELNTNVTSNVDCNNLLAYWGFNVISKNVCVNDYQKSICFGDSGGPMGCYDNNNVYRQVGITSWGVSYNCLEGPKVFTRVSSYLGWIANVMGIALP